MAIWSEARAYAFIDLARRGRRDWRGQGLALLSIAGCLGIVMALVLGASRDRHLTQTYFELFAIAALTAGYFVGLRLGVVTALRRPLASLISPDLTFRPRRVLLGMFIWFASWLITAAPVLLLTLPGLAELHELFGGALQVPPPSVLIPMVLILLVIPFQSGLEEMIFRGWLSQSLGQAIRHSWLLMPVIGVIFSLMHGFEMGWPGFFAYVTISLMCSGLSLQDGRLELAMGVHTANNVFALLVAGFTATQGASSSFLHPGGDGIGWIALAPQIVGALLTYFIGLWFIRRSAATVPAA